MSEHPCSNCRSRGSRCVVSPATGRCFGCSANNRQCDKVLNWTRIARFDRQEADLRVQLEALERERRQSFGEEEEHLALRRSEETEREDRHRAFLARSDRLCKRLFQIHSQRGKLLENEFESIEELEKLEAEKRSVQAPSESSAPESLSDFDRSRLEDPGVLETPTVSRESS